MTLKTLYDKLGTYNGFPKDGVIFRDIFPLLQDPNSRYELIQQIQSTIPDEIDCIVAPECRGAILAALVAEYLEIEFVIVRKKGKLPGKTYSYTYDTEYSTDTLEIQMDTTFNKKCWFIDDIYATGGTFDACKDLITQDGGKLLGGTVLLSVLNQEPDNLYEIFREVK